MTLDAVITVVLYSLSPYWMWLLLLVAMPVLAAIVFRRFSLDSAKRSLFFCGVIGVVVALSAPPLTGSSLSMLNGVADWTLLLLIALCATGYCLFLAAIVVVPRCKPLFEK